MKACDVSVIIPAYNEEKAIAQVIQDVRKALTKTTYTHEILVVDDASTDKTSDVALKQEARVVRRMVKGGSGSARKTGILEARGEIIVMLDGDGTYEASDIPRLLSYFPDYDQVNGARTSEEGTIKLLRVPAKWILKTLASYLAQTKIPDLNTGLKAFKKDIMLKYLWVLPKGFSCVTTMTLAFLVNGYAVKYIPTTYHKRVGVSKFHPIKDTMNYLSTIIRMIMYFAPLRVFGPFSFLILVVAGIKSASSITVTGTLQESDIILFLGALLILGLGLIADLIVAYQKK